MFCFLYCLGSAIAPIVIEDDDDDDDSDDDDDVNDHGEYCSLFFILYSDGAINFLYLSLFPKIYVLANSGAQLFHINSDEETEKDEEMVDDKSNINLLPAVSVLFSVYLPIHLKEALDSQLLVNSILSRDPNHLFHRSSLVPLVLCELATMSKKPVFKKK